jgi:hypothetical protein
MHFCYSRRSLEEKNKGRKREIDGGKGISEEFAALINTIGSYRGINEKSRPSWC